MSPGSGRLLCVGGVAGSGKTTLAGAVARARRAALVDLDSVTTPLVEAVAAAAGEVADLDAPRWAALRDARYRCLAAVVGDVLRAGVDVVAVAPFTREAADAAVWGAWGSDLGASSVATCWLDLDPGVAAARARARGAERDLAKAGAPSAPALVDRAGIDLVVDAAASPERLVDEVLAAWRG